MNGDLYFPPYQPPFSDLEHAQAGGGGGPGGSNFINGHPYDLIDDVPVTSFNPVSTSSYAKGGAVHYSGPRVKGSYPTIDRAYFYRVDGAEVITQSYWGQNFDVYFQTLVKSNGASIWAYGPNGDYNFKALVNDSKSTIEAYGEGKFIVISTEDLTDDDQPLAKFREVMGGDMQKRFFLCTDPGDALTCADLPDPLVRNVRAKRVESHISPLNLCGATDTYLDLANPFLQIAALGAATKVTVEPDTIWVSDPDQSLSVEPHAINIVSSAGSSEFSDTYLHVSRNTGAYASFDGAGWLELKNSAGKVIYLDPTEIVFTDGAKTATHNAEGFTAVDGTSYTGSVMANSVGVISNSGSSDLSDTYLQINSTGGGYATIDGAGWLELKNASNDQVYIGSKITLSSGNFSGSSELWPGTLKLYGDSSSSSIILEHARSTSAEINMESPLGSVGIRTADLTGTNTSAKFREVKVCVDDREKKAWVLMTEPE